MNRIGIILLLYNFYSISSDPSRELNYRKSEEKTETTEIVSIGLGIIVIEQDLEHVRLDVSRLTQEVANITEQLKFEIDPVKRQILIEQKAVVDSRILRTIQELSRISNEIVNLTA
jgi:hypothetical protein